MLKRKMMRDIKNHFGQFFSIFLLSFLAVCLYTGVAGEVVGVEEARENYQERTNLADGWIYGQDFTEAQMEKVATIEEVTDVQRRLYIEGQGENQTYLFCYFQESNKVNKPLCLEGEEYNPLKRDCVWLCRRFADEQGIAVGEDYTFQVQGNTYTCKVAGLIWSPEYEYYRKETDVEPNYDNVGYLFASIQLLPAEEQQFNQMVFRARWANMAYMEEVVSKALDGAYTMLLGRDGITNLTMLDDELSQHRTMAFVFPAFFIVVVLLTTITTMKRMVDQQRTQIGTLKALGMKKRKIYLHYLGYGFWTSLFGAVLGTIVGPMTLAPMLFKMKYYMDSSDEFMLPAFGIVYPGYFWLLAIVIVAICTLSTWVSCRRILRIAPAEALRPAPPKTSKKLFFERWEIWEKIGFSSRYNVRDMARNKTRTIFGLAGTISCMALLLCGLCCKDDFMSAVVDWYVKDLMGGATLITLEDTISLTDAQELRNQVQGELIMSDTIEIRIPGNTEKASFHMNVYEGIGIARATDEKLNVMMLEEDDFTLTKKAADALGVKEGDIIQWHIYDSDKWATTTITRITRSPFEQGAIVGRKAVENAGFDFTPTRLMVSGDVDENFAVQSEYITSINRQDSVMDNVGNYMELMQLFVGFMVVLAFLLAVVVLYSLGVLTFEERRREMATLKVLGFRSKKLQHLMLQQNIWLALSGALLGIPLGIQMLKIMINSLGDSMDIPANCSLMNVAISFAITIGVSILVNLFFTKRIEKLDMVSEIKGVE